MMIFFGVGLLFGATIVHVAWSAWRGLCGWGWLWWLHDVRYQIELIRWKAGELVPIGTTHMRLDGDSYFQLCTNRGGSFISDEPARVDCPLCRALMVSAAK